MHVLIVKMSSMGDVIHTLPALTDATNAIPDCTFDWVVEPAFAEIPAWHPSVKNVIPIPLRQWQKNWVNAFRSRDTHSFFNTLRQKKYDAIIDAQGLLKSAVITAIANGESHGLDKNSAREFLSSYFYNNNYFVEKNQHAILRTRKLFSNALKYPLPTNEPQFNIDLKKLPAVSVDLSKPYFVFIHGTTWPTKQYPMDYWKILIAKADQAKIPVYLPFGNDVEKKQAEALANQSKLATVLPKLSIAEMATVLKQATAVVAVDTGLGHLCAALGTPTISLYGPTNPKRVGTMGQHQMQLSVNFSCAPCVRKQCLYAKKHDITIMPPCFTTIDPDIVWEKIEEIRHAPPTKPIY